jgi:hypothetical protein
LDYFANLAVHGAFFVPGCFCYLLVWFFDPPLFDNLRAADLFPTIPSIIRRVHVWVSCRASWWTFKPCCRQGAGRNPACASPKCRPSKSGGIVSRPSLNFEPTFDQVLLWMTHACPQADPLDSMPLTSEGRTDIYKDGRKGRRPRLPDRNGDAIRPGDHGKHPPRGYAASSAPRGFLS